MRSEADSMTNDPFRRACPGRVSIDADLLRRLYLDERLTASRIASAMGCGETTICRHLRRLSIAARPRGPIPGSPASSRVWDVGWNADVAYAVGLIATDGNLSPRRGSMSFVSKDTDQVETLRRCLGLKAPVSWSANGRGTRYPKVQWSDRTLYEWLLAIGLTPAKSLTLGPLQVPHEYFADFFRGCVDGDGSIVVYTDRYHATKNERYVYERLYVMLASASGPFVSWIRDVIRGQIAVEGALQVFRRPGRAPLWRLRYAKRESVSVLRWMYHSPGIPCLARKRDKAEAFIRGW